MKHTNYELSLDDIPANIAIYKPTDDDNFIFVEFNKQASLTDKILSDELIGKKITDIFPGVKSMGLFDVLLRVSKTGKEELFNIGHYEDSRISGWRKNKVSRLDNGLIFVVYEDIDDKDIEVETYGKQLDAKTKEIADLKERYEIAINGTSDGLWDLDILANKPYFSPRWKEMLGYKDDELENEFKTWKDLVHPDDIEKVLVAIKKANSSEDEVYENIHRLKHKDGHWVWILARGKTIFNKDGIAIRMVGFHTDITKSKLAEQILRESEERFKSITNSAQDAIIMMDNEGKISCWNMAAEIIFGYTEEEALGKILSALIVPEQFFTAHNIGVEKFKITGKGPVIGTTLELLGLKKNGMEFPIELSLSSVLKDGKWNAIGIIRDITERKEMEDKIHELAFYDSLTKLPNRRLLHDRLNQTMAVSKRSEKYAALVFLDLDNFKPLNDTYGHSVGDLLLIEVARRLKHCVREMDTVARVGGDEFVLVINELNKDKEKSRAEVTVLAKKVLSALSVPYFFDINRDKASKIEYYCTASIGVSVFKADEESEESLFQHADTAMYEAKEAGKNRICFYRSSH